MPSGDELMAQVQAQMAEMQQATSQQVQAMTQQAQSLQVCNILIGLLVRNPVIGCT